MHGHGDGIDIFSYYFRKEDIGPLQRKCIVRPETIAWLLEIPSEAGYEWRTKVLRLETLYRLQLLDEKQQQAYAALLWHYVSETTGLPEGKDLHLFAYEKLPCLDANILVKSIKQWFLSRRLQDQFEDQQGCRIQWEKSLIWMSWFWSVKIWNRDIGAKRKRNSFYRICRHIGVF